MALKSFISFFLILTLATLACGSPTAATMPTNVPITRQLTSDQLKNAKYQLGARDDHALVQLADGKFQQGTDATTFDFAYVGLTEFISIGDLTGDGMNEAAAIFMENYGGTGIFAFLTVYTNVNGLPVFLYSTMIDDRPMINSLAIENGEVHLDGIVHGFEDGGCCPTLPTTRRYALVKDQLRLVHYTTDTPGGARRVIEITSPANDIEVSGSVQVTGAVSIAPFENNLTWSISGEAGNPYAAGYMMVDAPDLGAPGVFNETITLAGIPAGTVIYLEIQDINAADGSWFAMDAVKLLVK